MPALPFRQKLSLNVISENGSDSNDKTFTMIRVLANITKGLKVTHINAQSLHCKIDEFRYVFENSNIDVICVSETWFRYNTTDNVYELQGYRLFRADRIKHAGGVAIYVKNGIKCKVIKKSECGDETEHIFLEISNGLEKILLGNIYRPNRYINIAPLISSLSTLTLNYSNILISGDFNSNILVEKSLTDEMLAIGLKPVNSSIPTHFSATVNTLLDIFFTNDTSNSLLYDQLSVPAFSKHDLIYTTFKFNITLHNPDETYQYRDFKNIDYDELNYAVYNTNWNHVFDLVSVDEQVSFLQDNVLSLYNEFVPLKCKRKVSNSKPWFTNEIKGLIDCRDLAYSRWKRFKTSELHTLFCSLRKKVNSKIKSAKCSYYGRKYSTALKSKSKWKLIRDIGLVGKKTQNHNTLDLNELNTNFLNTPTQSVDVGFYHNIARTQNQLSFEFNCFSCEDVLEAFMRIKSNAVGFDEIHPSFLKAILPRILPTITYIFNNIVTFSTYPSNWKYAKVLPIPKAHNDYRPISILPFLSKVFERLLHDQIIKYTLDNDLLTTRQSGFRPQHSCITALLDVSEDIRSRLDDREIAFLVLLDHSKAFDCVNHGLLTLKLEKMFNFSQTAVRLISSYLSGRSQAVSHQGLLSERKLVPRGVPQGSILGPLLYSMYSNDLPTQLRHCKIQMYADDVQLYTSCKESEIDSCIGNINTDLASIQNWATSNGLCLNPSKSKCLVIYSSNRNTTANPELFINGSKIDVVTSAKNLGLVFNSTLTWSDHINVVAGRVYGMLRNLWSTQWFTPQPIKMLLAKTCLAPILFYGCELFSNCSSASKRKFNVVFNNITRYVFGLRRYDRVSVYSKQIFGSSFDNLLICKSLIFLHKIIYTGCPTYLYERLNFLRSSRGKRIVQIRHRYSLSENHFFINTIRSWNQLPIHIQNTSNARQFKSLIQDHYNSSIY